MTNAEPKFPETQRANLLAGLHTALMKRVDEDDLTYDQSFSEVALQILGFDSDSGTKSDGGGDFGVDFWIVDEKATTIFQFKSHDYVTAFDPGLDADSKYLTDLPRIYSLLQHADEVPSKANLKIKEFVREHRSAVHRYSLTEQSKGVPFEVTVYFCCLANGLTAQAREEYERIAAERVEVIGDQQLHITTMPIFIDDLIAEGWREANTDWRTSSGESQDSVELQVRGEMIETPKSLVFFTRAGDLVQAFDRFGYQIFEPNVRCELKRSKVNEAIRESIKHSRGRKEFKHLNNGITLICASFRKVRRQAEPSVVVRQPGVINGLQTVKSIHDAYNELNDSEKKHFERECEILVRLHTRQAVSDYKELVKSTNNQNPMQARNLRSNDAEQVYFERLFADLSWFYERKEGAWKAYRSDASLWGSLRGKKVSDFRSSVTGNSRNIDNLDMAQAWLSFVGFSNEAIHFKRDIFTDDKFYDLIFKKRVVKHGYDYGFAFGEPAVRNDAEEQAPNAQALLLAQLLREIADGLTPSRRQNRDEGVKRLKLENKSKEEQDAKLMQDAAFIRGLVLAGAKYLFVEFVGLILFRALGSGLYGMSPKILQGRSIKPMYTDRDLSTMQKVIKSDDYDVGDMIVVCWGLYNFCLENIIESASWRQQFEQAAVRSRFNYSEYNRKTLFGQLESLDRVYQKRQYPQPWSEGMEKYKGIFAYVKATLTNPK